jgi:hypothetical protein
MKKIQIGDAEKIDKQEKIVRFKCPSKERRIKKKLKKGVPSSSEGRKARFKHPWCCRLSSHGTLPSESARVCASGRHPRQMPSRLNFDLAAPRVRVASGALRPSSQLPTFDSESQQVQYGSELS